jgi:hypothetical protein
VAEIECGKLISLFLQKCVSKVLLKPNLVNCCGNVAIGYRVGFFLTNFFQAPFFQSNFFFNLSDVNLFKVSSFPKNGESTFFNFLTHGF